MGFIMLGGGMKDTPRPRKFFVPPGVGGGGGGVLYRRDISVGMCRRDSSTLSLYQT